MSYLRFYTFLLALGLTMATQENGIPSNITIPASVAIASSTSANPVVITTATPHGLTTGDQVDVVGHAVNTVANGIWPSTVTGASTFSIPVSGIGVGGATGAVIPQAFGATFQIPSDGDLSSAASVNVSLEALADRTAFNLAQTGAFKIVDSQAATADAAISTTWAVVTSTTTAWTAATAGAHIPLATIVGVIALDLLVVEVSTSLVLTGPASDFAKVSIGYANYVPGGSVTFGKMGGSGQLAPTGALGLGIRLLGAQLLATTGNVQLTLGQEQGATAGTYQTSFVADRTVRWTLYRLTGVNQ